MILRAPVAKGQTSDDNAIDVTFWMSGTVPNTLYRRVTSTGHSIDGVIRTVDVNDNSPSALAAHFALRHFGRRPVLQKERFGRRPAVKKERPYRADCQPDHQECNGTRDRPHFTPYYEFTGQGRVEFVSRLLRTPRPGVGWMRLGSPKLPPLGTRKHTSHARPSVCGATPALRHKRSPGDGGDTGASGSVRGEP
jgi:hypothetical protein